MQFPNVLDKDIKAMRHLCILTQHLLQFFLLSQSLRLLLLIKNYHKKFIKKKQGDRFNANFTESKNELAETIVGKILVIVV